MGSEIASLYAKLGLDSSQFQKGLTDSKGKLKSFGTGLNDVVKSTTGFSLASIGAAGAVVGVAKAVNQAAKDWSVYAEQMQKSAALSGVSTEEMSRLTQAADDFRVEQSALQSAMGMALKNGFVPTIENLARLSDEYIAMEDPADRAALATKIFGRQWQQIDPLLRQGGAAIREGTAAIADNLVVTDKAVKENVKYIAAVDNLEDAWTGVKNTVGAGVIPTLTTLLTLISDLTGGQKALNRSAADFINDIFKGSFLESGAHKAAAAAEVAADRFDKMAQLAKEIKKPTDDQSNDNQGFISQVSSWANVEKNYASSIEEVTTQQDKHARTLEYWSGVVARAPYMVEELTKKVELLSQEGGENSDAYRDAKKELEKWQTTLDGGAGALAGMNKQLDDDKQKIKDLAAEHELATHKIVLGYLEQQLAQDGLSKEETDFLLQKGVEWGVYSDTVIQEMRDAWAEVDQLTNHINGIPKTITISTILQESLPGYTKPKRATETAHANGGSWMIPMGYGYEGYRMPGGQTASGGEVITVTPKGKEASNQIILTDEQLKKIGEASGNATAVKLMQLGVLR